MKARNAAAAAEEAGAPKERRWGRTHEVGRNGVLGPGGENPGTIEKAPARARRPRRCRGEATEKNFTGEKPPACKAVKEGMAAQPKKNWSTIF